MNKHPYFEVTLLLGSAMLFTSLLVISSEYVTSKGEQPNSTADFVITPITRMIGMSDLVVIGTIGSIAENTFQFHVDEILFGQPVSLLNVKKVIPPEIIASRITPYTKGQRFALFLKGPEQEGAAELWQVIGVAGEGEMPVDDQYAYLTKYDLKGLEHTDSKIHGAYQKAQRYKLDIFTEAVKGYRDCFSWKLNQYTKNNKVKTRWVPGKACTNEAISQYRKKGWLHNYLSQDTLKRIP